MATFTVTTGADENFEGGTLAEETADGGGLSFFEAISLANANPGLDTITFDPSLASGPLSFSVGGQINVPPGSDELLGNPAILLELGLISITDDLIVDGDVIGDDGVPDINIFGVNNQAELIEVIGADVTFDGLRFNNGRASTVGAAIFGDAESDVTIMNSVFQNNGGLSGEGGGAVAIVGQGEIVNTVFNDNQSFDGGGALAVFGDVSLNGVTFTGNSAGGFGGAIFVASAGTLVVSDSTFTSNSSSFDGGAVFLNEQNGQEAVAEFGNVQFVSNSAGTSGGAIGSFRDLVISGSTFDGNIAGNLGGAVIGDGVSAAISGSTFIANEAGGGGGAIVAASRVGGDASVFDISDSIFLGNTANATGGAILNGGSIVVIQSSSIVGNASGTFGGGVGSVADDGGRSAETFILNSAIAANESVQGGGFANLDGSLTAATNVLLFNNFAGDAGGGFFNEEGAEVVLTGATVEGNLIGVVDTTSAFLSDGALRVRNSIIVNNTDLGVSDNFAFDPSDTVFEGGNIVSPITGFNFSQGTQVITDPAAVFASVDIVSAFGEEFERGGFETLNIVSFVPILADGAAVDGGDARFFDESFAGLDLNGDGDTEDTITTDSLGNRRVFGDEVDLGASEFGSFPEPIDVFRFQNAINDATFITAFVEERDFVDANLPQYVLQAEAEFEAFDRDAAEADGEGGIEEVYRFFNLDTGGHFFTTSEAERDTIIDTLPLIRFEGVGFSAYTEADAVEGLIPVFRIFNLTTGTHLFITSEEERDEALATGDFFDEGVAFYAFPNDDDDPLDVSAVADTIDDLPVSVAGDADFGALLL